MNFQVLPHEQLLKRGIAAQAEAMGWQSGSGSHGGGWVYPVYDLSGNVVAQRYKAYDSNTEPKYLWVQSKASYYHIGAGLRSAIEAANGILYIANGEPAVLAFHAASIYNVLSFFGEGSAPPDLIPWLQSFGVCAIRYFPDRDSAGDRAANKLHRLFKGTGIDFDCRRLPETLPPKADANDLWQCVEFDVAAFQAALTEAPVYQFADEAPKPPPKSSPREAATSFTNTVDWLEENRLWWLNEVMPCVEAVAPVQAGGKYQRRPCPNPKHTDKRPSFRISYDRDPDGFPVCSCSVQDEEHARDLVAEWVGARPFMEWWKAERQPLLKAKRQNENGTQPESVDPALYADICFEARWVSDADDRLPRSGVVCVIADKGTGKSFWARRVKQDVGEALVITPYIALTHIASEFYDLENYEGLTAAQCRQAVHRLAITLNSIRHLARVDGEPVPHLRLLILDELSRSLEALGSPKLFPRGNAVQVYRILEELIRRADLVLVTDADLSSVDIEWLRSLRPDVTVAVNTYVRPYGEMEALPGTAAGRDALLTEIGSALAAKQGAILVASSSRTMVENLEVTHQEKYHILTIHSGNSTNAEQRAFLENPERIVDYDAVFVSPSFATGANITTQVYRTFGIFNSKDLDARLCLQMLARTRSSQKTVVWVDGKKSRRCTDSEMTYNSARKRAEGTAKLCDLNEAGFLDFDPLQKDFLTVQAKLEAQKQRSLCNLRADFLQQAAHNYTVTEIEGELTVTGGAAAVALAAEAREVQWKQMVLNSVPISPVEHEWRSRQGIRTDEDNAGLERYLLETFYYQSITSELYDFDARSKGQFRLSLFIDLLRMQEGQVKARDIQEMWDRVPMLNRGHHTHRWLTIRTLIDTVWGSIDQFTPDQVLTGAEINERVSGFQEQYAGALYRYGGGRRDQSLKPLKVLQRVLRRMGLRLEEIRSRDKQAPKRYRLKRDAWQTMNHLADGRIQGLERAREQETVRCYKNP